VACVRLLAQAGANVNSHDNEGNTSLHETFLTDVEEELLKVGADLNARNKDGETPIFTTVDNDAIPLITEHGADLTIVTTRARRECGDTSQPLPPPMRRLARILFPKTILPTIGLFPFGSIHGYNSHE
jgi:ankyrin repeat protein